MMTTEMTPQQATDRWRESALNKLEHALRKISAVQGFFASKTQPWRLCAEAYELIHAIYIDLRDLQGK